MCQCHPFQQKKRKSKAPSSAGRLKIVERLKARDGDRCFWCRVRLRGDIEITIEHLLPRSLGGGNAIENLRLACAWCNHKRGVRPEDEFREWLEKNWASSPGGRAAAMN